MRLRPGGYVPVIAELLALVLVWNAVTQDCHGGLEAAPLVYEVHYALGSTVLDPSCPLDENGNPQACAIWQQYVSTTAATSKDLGEPAPGEVLVWVDPITRDRADNLSTQPCSGGSPSP